MILATGDGNVESGAVRNFAVVPKEVDVTQHDGGETGEVGERFHGVPSVICCFVSNRPLSS